MPFYKFLLSNIPVTAKCFTWNLYKQMFHVKHLSSLHLIQVLNLINACFLIRELLELVKTIKQNICATVCWSKLYILACYRCFYNVSRETLCFMLFFIVFFCCFYLFFCVYSCVFSFFGLLWGGIYRLFTICSSGHRLSIGYLLNIFRFIY